MSLVFTYGTLTSSSLMHSLTATAVDMGADSLNGFRLESCYYLTPVPDDSYTIEGVVWQLSEADLKRIDAFEGAPHYYTRAEVTLKSGRAAWVYTMNRDCSDYGFCPSSHTEARRGYEEHGISPKQIDDANVRKAA